MNEADAVFARAVKCATEIVQGQTEPYEGAKVLWQMWTELSGLVEELLVFVGLASEWEDSPEHRAAYEDDIRRAADRFRARFGP